MSDLKPCPFCGSERVNVAEIVGDFFAVCGNCGAQGKQRATISDAIGAWNRRAGDVPERTCKVRQSYFDSDNELNEIMEGIAFSPEDTVACICEACGHAWRYDRGIRPNYCPQCGSKVAE